MQPIGVETTQHVQLAYNPASVGERLLAFLLDGFVIVGYFLLMQSFVGALEKSNLMSSEAIENQQWVFVLIYSIVPFFYHLASEVLWNGKSFGKWIMGLQVVRTDGTSPSFSNYLIRWLFRLVEITFTTGLVAFMTVLLNGKGQRLGDIAAKTAVIKTRRKVKLSDTLYSELETEYEARYPQVKNLSDKDITTIKEVLASRKGYEYATWFVMIQRTANIIQMKMDIKKLEVNADDFLKQVISDYNHVHQN
ncbi:MAG: RDD family protein [Balneolaceae bacterium]|nr:RDD family protein [Balneolaceae bacterium]